MRGRNLVTQNRGATKRTLQALDSLLGNLKSTVKSVDPLRANGAPIA